MKPETITKLEYHLTTLSVENLWQFLALIVREIYSRGTNSKSPGTHPAINNGKDCEPNHGA